jgi:hypothetical protein
MPQDAIASLLQRLVRLALVLFGWQGASFFTALEDRELLIESGDQLSDSRFCESVLPDGMLALEPLKARLQVTQL